MADRHEPVFDDIGFAIGFGSHQFASGEHFTGYAGIDLLRNKMWRPLRVCYGLKVFRVKPPAFYPRVHGYYSAFLNKFNDLMFAHLFDHMGLLLFLV